MATKDYKVTITDQQNEYTFSAKKKNAIYVKGIKQDDIDTNSFRIDGDNLLFSAKGKDFVVSNYTGIKYIKTDNALGKTELLDIISHSYVDNTANVINLLEKPYYNKSKLAVTGTNYNDKIDLSESGYEPIGKTNIKKNRGLTITGGNGNDEITGTDYNDTIKGGNGNDTITGGLGVDTITGGAGVNVINYSKGDGNDIINLTKGENFTLNFTDLTKDDLRFEFANKNKDLRIYTSKTNDDEYITIKNFVKKDVTNNSNTKKKLSDTSSVELIFNNAESSRIDLRTATDLYITEITKNYTGTWLSETITAEDYIVYEDKKKEYESDDWTRKGLTIKTGSGNNTVIGSNYSDTIIGGNGDDYITAGFGNDKLTGGKGNNTFVFSSDSGKDTITDAKLGDIIKIEDVNAVDLKYVKSGNNLEIYYDKYFDEENMIIIQNYYKATNKIDKLIANGDEISLNNIILDGIAGKGTIYGSTGDDTIIPQGTSTVKIKSGKGNDVILGDGSTKRVMYFYEGDGNDIVEGGGIWGETCKLDTLVFSSKINDIKCELDINGHRNLTISYGDKGDTVYLPNYGGKDDCRRYIQVGNKKKTIYSYLNFGKDINIYNESNKIIKGTDKDDYISVAGDNNTIYANDGDDYITIFDRNSIIYSGKGNDLIDLNGRNAEIHFQSGDGNDIIKDLSINSSYPNSTKLYFDNEENLKNINISIDNDNNISFLYGNNSLYISNEHKMSIYCNDSNNLIELRIDPSSYYSSVYLPNAVVHAGSSKYSFSVASNTIFAGDNDNDFSAVFDENGHSYIYGGTGNDTYSISNNWDIHNTKREKIYIKDNGGNDSLSIRFEKEYTFCFINIDKNNEYDNNLYVLNTDSLNMLVVNNFFEELNKIENITLNNPNNYLDRYNFDTTSFSFDEIKQSVVSWLTSKGYADVNSAIEADSANIQVLIDAGYFSGLEWKPIEH